MTSKSKPYFIYVLLLILNSQFSILNSYAQQPGGGGGRFGGGQMPDLGSLGAVAGMIVDENKQPVQYAMVYVQNTKDSLNVTGGITDENGRILIKDIPWGSYRVQINAMGYNQQFTPDFSLSQSNPYYMMRQFALSQKVQQLEGVEVTGQKEMLQQNLDKKVYNLENSIITDGATAVEALAEIPSVDVDIEGNVSLRGSGNVTILVDGRPTNLTLDQIPASEIESIEVITNPSARLDPDGMGGIINVILKKKKKPGINAFFSGGLVTAVFKDKFYLSGGNLSMNLNYTYHKVSMFLNYNFRSGQWRNAGNLSRTSWFQRDSLHLDSTFLMQKSNNNSQYFGHNIRAGLDFFINKKNTLSFVFGYNRHDNNDTTNLFTNNYYWILGDTLPYNTYKQDGAGSRYGNNFSGNINYKKTFEKQGMEFIADLYYTELFGNQRNQYLQKFSKPDKLPDYFQKTNTDMRNRTATGKVDFVTPVGNGGRIETGYKLSYRSIWQDYRLYYGKSYTDPVENQQQRNNFQFQEWINSVYFIYSNSFWKVLKIQLGLRGEFATTSSKLFYANGEIKNHKRNFLKPENILYPTVHIRYDITDAHSLQLSYSRRVTRPSFWNLNPFVDVSDKQNLRMGNPNLGPEFADNLELGYSMYLKKTSFSATVFYRHRTDLITRFTQLRQAYINNDTIFYTLLDDDIYTLPIDANYLGSDTFTYTLNSSQNLNKSQSVGLELVYGQRLWNFWRINFSGDFYYVKINSEKDLIDPNLSKDWAFGFRLNQTFTLPKNWDIQLNFRFRSRSITTGSMGFMGGGVGQGRRNAQYSLNFGIKKSFLKDKAMSVSLNIRDLIYNPKTIINSFDNKEYGGYTSTSTRWRSVLQMNLTITYKLNNYKQRREPQQEIDTGEAPTEN